MDEELYGSISAPPQNRFLGGMANFMKFLEQEKPEFLPSQLDVMGLMRQLALPQASTIENLSYGNSPFTMPPQGTGAMIPQVKTGRKAEVADLIGMISGVPGGKAVIDSGTKISQDALNAYMKMIRETPPIGAVNPSAAMPQIPQPQKSDLGFYSQLEAATIPLQNKGTGTQFLAQIEKTPGVKPEEIKFTGLDEFLRNRETVTKPEIQQFLEENKVNLQEVRLGGSWDDYRAFQRDEYESLPDELLADKAGIPFGPRQQKAFESEPGFREKIINKLIESDIDYFRANPGDVDSSFQIPKFSGYTLPNGQNYREILLTLPERPPTEAEVRAIMGIPEGTKLLESDFYYAKNKLSKNYNSPHFSEPNILAHMRVNDRVVDGKKTLFIEEIQSDWHQAGRKQGYAEIGKPFEVFDPKNGKPIATFVTEKEAKEYADNLGSQFDYGKSEGVPDAPFKTSWHELSLKRAIQEASEKGYDKIAFTTGQTQAARYDLSKQISSIKSNYMREGTINVEVRDKSGNIIIPMDSRHIYNESMLADVVGKEMAEKIISKGKGVNEFSGLDLQVGGEGMKGFYDNILPKSLEKLGKKFDAKVTKTTMDGTEVWQMDITPKMRESVTTKGQPLFQVAPAIPAGGLLGQDEE
jgi:hypothetical protein